MFYFAFSSSSSSSYSSAYLVWHYGFSYCCTVCWYIAKGNITLALICITTYIKVMQTLNILIKRPVRELKRTLTDTSHRELGWYICQKLKRFTAEREREESPQECSQSNLSFQKWSVKDITFSYPKTLFQHFTFLSCFLAEKIVPRGFYYSVWLD